MNRLYEDIASLIEGQSGDPDAIAARLHELASANNRAVARYRQRSVADLGIPDTAFRGASVFHFDESSIARTFRTSGTSGPDRGSAAYSERGLDLMKRSIVANGRRHVFAGLDRPAVVRLVPESRVIPDGVMPYGMEILSQTFGAPEASESVVGPTGLDLERLIVLLDRAVVDRRPVVMIGGSFAFVHLCDALTGRGKSWELPAGSRMIDAGGFKGRSRELDVDALRGAVGTVFGIARDRCNNIFGMTELASQLYDAADVPLGPKGERPKGTTHFVGPRVRDPFSWRHASRGPGLLEVADLCILDRPHVVLTGDWAVAGEHGVAITGRVRPSESRGCALHFESRSALLAGSN